MGAIGRTNFLLNSFIFILDAIWQGDAGKASVLALFRFASLFFDNCLLPSKRNGLKY